jgi:crotonobetainyl-CoA:carnitine CoA-transferase CaiB-like acyl-CoA transferase
LTATLREVNEHAHVDLNDADLGDEPAILGAADCPFFDGPGGERFTVATSMVGSRTFPSYLRAMRRGDLADDPRFATASARKANLAALHDIIQTWIVTFADMGTLDAQFDEAKIAMGEMRSLQALSETDWSGYWGAVQEVSDRRGAPPDCRAGHGVSPLICLSLSVILRSRVNITATCFANLV